eukprot:gene8811-11896_t
MSEVIRLINNNKSLNMLGESDAFPRQNDVSHDAAKAVHQTFTVANDVAKCDDNENAKNGIKVLLVDDSDMIRKIVSKKLLNAGYHVDCAENGSVAVNKVTKSMQSNRNSCEYDVIIMDLQMPVMDGLEATLRIREYEKSNLPEVKLNNPNNLNNNHYRVSDELGSNHILIIGCSANVDSNNSNTQQYPGMDYMLEKPFNLNRFNEIIMFVKR